MLECRERQSLVLDCWEQRSLVCIEFSCTLLSIVQYCFAGAIGPKLSCIWSQNCQCSCTCVNCVCFVCVCKQEKVIYIKQNSGSVRVHYYPVHVLSVWMCVCVCRQKTWLFAVLLLENRHQIALYSYRSASQFIFFERCLQSRMSLLSSAMAMVSNSWRKCQQTMQISSPSETQELRCGTESRSIPAQSKANNLLSFTE